MNGIMKKTAAVFLAAVMILTCVPFTGIDISGIIAFASEIGTDIYYSSENIYGDYIFLYSDEYSDGVDEDGYPIPTVKIIRYIGDDKNVVVPEKINGISVTVIGEECFNYYGNPKNPYLKEIESIVLPDTVVRIGTRAFSQCQKLTSVNIPESTEIIDDFVFSGCDSLKEITLPGKDIEYKSPGKAFSLSGIEKVNLNDGITTIPKGFLDGSKVTSLTIPQSVTKIDKDAFDETLLNELTITGNSKLLESYDVNAAFMFMDKSSDPKRKFYMEKLSVSHLPIEIPFSNLYDIVYDEENGMWNFELTEESNAYRGDTEGFVYYLNDKGQAILERYHGTDTEVTVPKKIGLQSLVVGIDKGAFEGSSITKVTLPDAVTEIGNSAFADCEKLEEIVLSASLEKIGNSAFEGCGRLEKITLPEGVTNIGVKVFKDCHSLKEVNNWPESMKYIPSEAFCRCYNLTGFTIPDVEIICSGAFNGCGITVDEFGSSLREIGASAFSGDYLNDEAIYADIKDTDLSENLEYIGCCAFSENYSITELKVPEKVKYIGSDAFAFTSIGETELPISLETIGEYAFYQAPIKFVKIPDNVVYIGDHAFEESSLKKITIPSGVRRVGNFAFQNCADLEIIIIENGVEEIGEHAFAGCGARTLSIPESVKYFGKGIINNSEIEELYFNAVNYKEINRSILLSSNLKKLVIGDNVTEVPDHIASGCTELEEVVLPDGISKISKSAFSGCVSLKKINLPEGLKDIKDYAFDRCGALSEISLPDSLEYIGTGAFNSCTALTEITLPAGLKQLENTSFSNCKAIHTINYNAVDCELHNLKKTGTTGIYFSLFSYLKALKTVNIGEGVKVLPEFFLAGVTTLDTIELPSTVTDVGFGAFALSNITSFTDCGGLESIEEYAFYGCEYLENVSLGSEIMIIGEAAFSRCGLSEIYIPDNVMVIGEEAFKSCSQLTSVRMSPNVDYIPRETFRCCYELSEFKWESERKLIARLAFGSCEKLTDFDFMNVAKLYDNSFLGSGVSVVQLGENAGDTRTPLTTIEVQSFKDCDNLLTLGVGGNVSSIKNQAFADCSNLETAVISDSVTSIADDAFDGCDKLTIYCSENSYAHSYAKAQGINVSTLVIAPIPNQIYTGFEIKPSISVSASGSKLSENIDFGVSYANNINVGNADVTVNGKGDFRMFSSKAKFTIVTKSISGVSVANIVDQVYTGSAVTPKLIITDGLKVLTEKEDYTLTYSNNINEGTAKVKITGIGNYSGSTSAQFNIVKMNDTQSFISRFIYNAGVFFSKIISFITNIFSSIF